MNDRQDVAWHLEQTARDLVQRFTEIELIHDWPALTRLGSGVLWIDLATGRSHHNGQIVEPLVATAGLQAWLRESLASAHLSKTAIQDATLTARLSVEHYSGQRRGGDRWTGDPTAFVGCRAEIQCRLAVDGFVGEASATDLMEWPEPVNSPGHG